MRKAVWASIAAAAVISPMVVATTIAHAAPSKDTTRFCTVPATMRSGCTISVPIGAATRGVREGGTVKAILTGAPNQTIDFAVFHITGDAQGKVTKLTRVSKPTPAALDKSGNATVTITIDPMKSPMTGGDRDFIVATADTTDPKAVPGTISKKWDQFQVNSARAKFVGVGMRPINGRYYAPNELISYTLRAGIPGDTYVVQLKLNGKWVTMNTDHAKNGVVSDSNSASVSWKFSTDVPAGKHPLRVSNSKKLDDPVHTGEFEIVSDPNKVPTATPTKPGTATPTKPATPKVTATPTPSDTRKEVRLTSVDGQRTPQYTLDDSNVMKTTGKLTDADGKPISGNISLYSTKNGVRTGKLNATHPRADGTFELTVTLPANWRTDTAFNVELVYEGDAEHKPLSLRMRPQASPTGDASPEPKPGDDKPSEDLPPMPPTKDEKGGLAKTGR